MNKLFLVTFFHRSVLAYIKRQFRGALIVILFLGLSYFSLFIGASRGQAGTPDTPTECPTVCPTEVPSNTPLPTDTPTYTLTDTLTDTPTDTPTYTPTYTLTDTPTNTYTPTETLTDTPTDTLTYTPVPADTSTFTPTRTITNTVLPTHTSPPGGPTDTPRPPKILPQRNTAVKTGTAGATATQTMIGGAAVGTITPESSPTLTPSPTAGAGSIGPITIIPLPAPVSKAVNRTYLLFLAILGLGGGAVSVNKLWGIKENNGSSHAGGGAAVPPTAINPTTVGALGFAAWLAGQVPVLTPDEKEVLTKVENGIGSAENQVGGVSDLNKISETGTEEFLQLTKSSPFLS